MYGPGHHGVQPLGAPSGNARMNSNLYIDKHPYKKSILQYYH